MRAQPGEEGLDQRPELARHLDRDLAAGVEQRDARAGERGGDGLRLVTGG